MSLLRNMGNIVTGVSVKNSKYTHNNGAHTIAMESMNEIQDIFMAASYVPEQIELQAIHEGVDVSTGEYGVVMEGAIKNAWAKIVEFFKKLWEKIKAFFASIRRYIDSIFMSGKDFAIKYEKEIKAIKSNYLTGFEYKMYKYNDSEIDNVSEIAKLIDSVDAVGGELDSFLGAAVSDKKLTDKDGNNNVVITTIESIFSAMDAMNTANNSGTAVSTDTIAKLDASMAAMKEAVEKHAEEQYDTAVKTRFGGTEDSDIAESLFKKYRNDATGEGDKEDIKVDISSLCNTLKNSMSLSKVDSIISKTNSNMQKTIANIDKHTKTFDKHDVGEKDSSKDKFSTKYKSLATSIGSTYSNYMSKMTTLENRSIDAWKVAFNERATTYKAAIIAGINYAKKKEREK